MELWIRTQDRERLLKCNIVEIRGKSINQINFIFFEGYEIVGYFDDNIGYEILGAYKTKERALEVLDEIQEAQLGNFHYRCPSNVKVSSKEDTIVYEMPEK